LICSDPELSCSAKLLELQVQHCPHGCADWAETAHALAAASAALIKVSDAQATSQQVMAA